MRLKTELEACGCNDSEERFKQRLIDEIAEFGDMTIDDLLCDPVSAARYCDAIRQQVGTQWLHNAAILKPLLNIRKCKNCPPGLKSRRQRTHLGNALKDAQCGYSPDEFKELLIECHTSMYRDQTIDGLLCHPAEAKALCSFVRAKTGSSLSDPLILRTLMNIRKAAKS